MKKSAESHVTMAQLAAAAGLSRATVSYALRGDPKIPPETAQHVHTVAASLGYRPNPRVATLMAHIRRSRSITDREPIAFVWVHTPKDESRRDPFLQFVFHAARQRAEQLGYMLQEFWTDEPGMTTRRLSRILKARGIVGVLFSPVMHQAVVRLDFDWADFSSAVIGSAEWVPELHHAGHNHYFGMRAVLAQLATLKCERPALVLTQETNERGRRAWQAAFLAYHPLPRVAPQLILDGLPRSARELRGWLRRHKPDAVIFHNSEMVRQFESWCPVGERPHLCTLHWTPDLHGSVPGIDQRFDAVAANAVDLIVTQLLANERGAPEIPRTTLIPGAWVPASA